MDYQRHVLQLMGQARKLEGSAGTSNQRAEHPMPLTNIEVIENVFTAEQKYGIVKRHSSTQWSPSNATRDRSRG